MLVHRFFVAAAIGVTLTCWGPLGAAESGAAGGGQPLRVALAGSDAVPSPMPVPQGEPQTGEQLLARVIQGRDTWFQWVPANTSYDVLVAITQKQEGKNQLWEQALKSRLDVPPPKYDKALSGLEALLMLDLERLYIIKNLAVLRESGVDVKLELKGRGNAPVLKEGETVTLEWEAPVDGFVNLINVQPNGKLVPLFPIPGRREDANGLVHAKVPMTRKYDVGSPFGAEYVKAIFTTTPLDLQFLAQAQGNRPSREEIEKLLKRYRDTVQTSTRSVEVGSPQGGTVKVGTAEVHFRTIKKQ